MTMRILSIGFLLSALFVPVVSADAGSLSFNLFDLAEWASLLPAERSAEVALVLSFMLRIQIIYVMLFVVFLLTMRKDLRGLAAPFVIAVAVSQLPPPEFISQPGDLNYRQQALITALCLAGGSAALALRAHNYTKAIWLLLISGSGLLLAALWSARSHLTQYQIFDHFGLGGPALMLAYLLATFVLWQQKRAPQRSLHSPN
jgi:hypothetical protein